MNKETRGRPNELARVKGIKIGSIVKRTGDTREGQQFTVCGFDQDGDPYGLEENSKVGAFSDRCTVVKEHTDDSMKKLTKNNALKVMHAILNDEERCKEILEAWNDVLDDMRLDDFFGTEGQCDPRGDGRED